VPDVVSRHIEEDTPFVEAVNHGGEGSEQGEYLTREQRSNP
jgi:hypothetical protein